MTLTIGMTCLHFTKILFLHQLQRQATVEAELVVESVCTSELIISEELRIQKMHCEKIGFYSWRNVRKHRILSKLIENS